jgi:ABC-2 type transport system ATP-binding protein
MSVTTPTTRVRVEGASKHFRLRHTHTLKDYVVRAILRRDEASFEEFTALNDVSFEVSDGETVALLGLNGSGKSTLLKLISGVMRPSSGSIRLRGKIAGLIEVGAGFHPDLTGRENVYLNAAILGMSEAEIDAKFDEIVAFSEIESFIDTEVKFYSSGMFLRLAFAVAVHTDPDVFLVDEILAVGDEPFQRKCIAKIEELKASGKALVIVSHDLELMGRLCDRAILLSHGTMVADGPADDVIAQLRGEIG